MNHANPPNPSTEEAALPAHMLTFLSTHGWSQHYCHGKQIYIKYPYPGYFTPYEAVTIELAKLALDHQLEVFE
jgi:hypothetical protein